MTLSSQLARSLKRGDSFDIECSKTSHRLRVARGLLAELGATPTIQHRAPNPEPRSAMPCRHHPDSPSFGRPHFGIGYDMEGCDYRCITVWPEWVNDEVFQHAANAAEAIQNLRGVTGAAQINAAREEAR